MFEKLSSLWRNYQRRHAGLLEIENLTQREFENLAADLGFEPGELRSLCTAKESMNNVLDFRLKKFGISKDKLDFATLAEMHSRCIHCASKRVCKYDLKRGKTYNPCPFDCPNLDNFQKLRTAA